MKKTQKDNKTLRILLIEDDKEYIEGYDYFKDELEKKYNTSFDITVSTTLEEYESIKDKNFDVVLTDMFIPTIAKNEVNKEKNSSAWFNYLTKASEKTNTGIVKGELSVRDFDRSFKEGHYFLDYLDKNTWEQMKGSSTLESFMNGESINSILTDKKLKTAPHGVNIFLEQFYEKDRPVCMVTSDHAHGGEGSPFMMYLQNEGIDKYRSLPFESLDGGDIRLLNGVSKTSSDTIEESIQNILMLKKLYGAGYKNCIGDVSCALVTYPNISKEEILLGEKIENLDFYTQAKKKIEKDFQWYKKEMQDPDCQDWVKKEYPKKKQVLEDLKSNKIEPFDHLEILYSKNKILNGTKIIKEVFYNIR